MSKSQGDDKEISEKVFWEKVTALATIGTLIASTFIGIFGVFLGARAIKLSGEVASAQMRPLLHGERVWFGAGGDSHFTIANNGFGPLHVKQSIYVHFDDKNQVADSFVLAPQTSSDDILEFLKLTAFTNDGRVTVGVPSVGSTLGAGSDLPIIRVSEHQQRSQFFRAQNKDAFDKAIRHLGVCIVYDALDKRRQLFSERGACETLKITKGRIRLRKP